MGDEDWKESAKKLQETLERDAEGTKKIGDALATMERNHVPILEYLKGRVAGIEKPPPVRVPEK